MKNKKNKRMNVFKNNSLSNNYRYAIAKLTEDKVRNKFEKLISKNPGKAGRNEASILKNRLKKMQLFLPSFLNLKKNISAYHLFLIHEW